MAKKTERQGFVLYHSLRKPLEMLDDAQRGKLFLAILDYSEHGLLPDFNDAVIDMAFAFIRDKLDRDSEAYKDKCEKRALAGSKGGKQRVANQANATFAKQTQANQANASKSSQPEPEPEPELKPKPELEPEQDKKKRKRFTPPTLEEVKAYCLESGYRIDAERFIDYYESNGWMVGRNKMKDWKAAVRNWAKREDEKPKKEERRDPYEDVDFSWLREIHQVGG